MSNGKTLAVVDFDNTLFKTKEFWRECLFPAYEKLGMSRETLEEAFKEATALKADYFVIDNFIDSLADRVSMPQEKLLVVFKETVFSEKVKDFFYPSSTELLAAIKKAYDTMLLVSYGDKAFKEEFFKCCDLETYFDPQEMIITNEPKVRLLPRFAAYTHITYINDVFKETEDLLRETKAMGIVTDAYLVDHKNSLGEVNTSEIKKYRTLNDLAYDVRLKIESTEHTPENKM